MRVSPMKTKTFATVAGAAALALTPVVAQARAATAAERAPAPVEKAEGLRGGFIIPLVAVIAIILGILVATQGGNDHHLPTSP